MPYSYHALHNLNLAGRSAVDGCPATVSFSQESSYFIHFSLPQHTDGQFLKYIWAMIVC
jgi:hypothetical protein